LFTSTSNCSSAERPGVQARIVARRAKPFNHRVDSSSRGLPRRGPGPRAPARRFNSAHHCSRVKAQLKRDTLARMGDIVAAGTDPLLQNWI